MFSLLSIILQAVILCQHVSDLPPRDGIIVEDSAVCDNVMTVSSCWSADSLYFRFDVKDTKLRAFQTQKDSPELFLDDMVEVLLDCNMDRVRDWLEDDFVYHINLLGQKKDDRGLGGGRLDVSWDGVAKYRITLRGTLNDDSDIDDGYTVELAIPWTEIGRKPHPGLRMGVNFACSDNDGLGRQLMKWQPSDITRDTDTFGIIKLVGK